MSKRKSGTTKGVRAQQRETQQKEIRAKLVALKRKGLIFKNKSLRDYKPTTYAKRRLKELEGILTGEKVAIKAPKPVRYKYQGMPNTQFAGGKIIVPNRPGARAQIRRGMIAFVEPLGDEGHYIEEIVLPVNLRRPDQVLRWIKSGEPERLKHPNEYFAFKMFGNPSLTALPNIESLYEYLTFYNWFQKPGDVDLKPGDDDEAPAALELFRVFPPDAWDDYVRANKQDRQSDPFYIARMERNKRRRAQMRRARSLSKRIKEKREAGPTPQERADKAAKQKAYRAKVQGDQQARLDRNERDRLRRAKKGKKK